MLDECKDWLIHQLGGITVKGRDDAIAFQMSKQELLLNELLNDRDDQISQLEIQIELHDEVVKSYKIQLSETIEQIKALEDERDAIAAQLEKANDRLGRIQRTLMAIAQEIDSIQSF